HWLLDAVRDVKGSGRERDAVLRRVRARRGRAVHWSGAVTEAPRAIVEIPWGRAAVRKALIAPGDRLTVGRSAPVGLVVPNDRQMSGVHFEVSWDGARCRIRDLGSANGTWLDGQQVTESDVENGAFIRAGDTVFMLYIEGATVRRLPADPPALAARKDSAL